MLRMISGTVLALCFLFGGAAFAADGATTVAMDHDMTAMGHDSAQPLEMRWDEQNDATFLAGMIAHHQGAIDMTRAIEGKTKDPEVRRWADGIVSAQESEMRSMREMLRTLGLNDEVAAEDMRKHMEMMMASPVSSDPEINYIKVMIPHHAGAIDMAVPALAMSRNRGIRKLAEEIIVAQTREIAEFRRWLDSKNEL